MGINVVVFSFLEGLELSEAITCIRFVLYIYTIIMELRPVNMHFHLRLSFTSWSSRIPLPMQLLIKRYVKLATLLYQCNWEKLERSWKFKLINMINLINFKNRQLDILREFQFIVDVYSVFCSYISFRCNLTVIILTFCSS